MEAGVGSSEGPHPVPVQRETGFSPATTAGKLPTTGCLLLMLSDRAVNMAACGHVNDVMPLMYRASHLSCL